MAFARSRARHSDRLARGFAGRCRLSGAVAALTSAKKFDGDHRAAIAHQARSATGQHRPVSEWDGARPQPDVASRSFKGRKWWAWQGLNLRPLRCQHSALPLSYTPTTGDLAVALRLRKALRRVATNLPGKVVELGRNPWGDGALGGLDHRRPTHRATGIGRSHPEIGKPVPHHQLRGQPETARTIAAHRQAARGQDP